MGEDTGMETNYGEVMNGMDVKGVDRLANETLRDHLAAKILRVSLAVMGPTDFQRFLECERECGVAVTLKCWAYPHPVECSEQ
jgi:hypothetical protein